MANPVKLAVETTIPGPPPMADVSDAEVYRGRTPGPYVPGTSWRTCWKLSSNFLVLRKATEEGDRRLIFLQEAGNYELLESLLQGRELEEVISMSYELRWKGIVSRRSLYWLNALDRTLKYRSQAKLCMSTMQSYSELLMDAVLRS
ncbi:unnamed protein product [Nippostrongylus brasiliensis]|uniref:HET domain-containing protein n=1 Tax=Nippostrongylus brasiliensis TaxID=27835 RepID=A0A0N4XVL9_NIPBR|nr:unnamed protein product [Nippostrongylus brasiliensis]